jgi:hypothetical protein
MTISQECTRVSRGCCSEPNLQKFAGTARRRKHGNGDGSFGSPHMERELLSKSIFW